VPVVRLRQGGGGDDPGGGGLSTAVPASPPGPPSGGDAQLRPALELAFDLAVIGARSSPAINAPRAMRPFLQFSKLPDNALAVVRRALDEDEGFRARVAGLADEAELGRAGWLLVERPEGWEDELASLTAAADAAALLAHEEQEERSARRRLAHAEQATQRALDAAARARAELVAASAEVATERRARRAAHDEAARLMRRVASLEGERDSARRRAAASAAEIEGAHAEAAELRAELADARAALGAVDAEAKAGALRAEADRLRSEVGRQPGARSTGPEPGGGPLVGRARSGTVGAAAAEGARAPGGVATGPAADDPRSGVTDGAGPDVAAVARAVAAAAAAAAALGLALEEASAALEPSPGAGEGSGEPVCPPAEVALAPGRAARRRPAPLPPAVFEDTTEAAAHLVRVPGALVLVDGYNAAKALWPDVAPLELRERLIDALSGMVGRTGASVHVVYDGADLGIPQARPVSSRGVRVSFSPPDVEADDVILDLIGTVPLDRPVVVASSDRRVQEGSRRRGANVISSAQLAAVLGRS